MKPKNYDYIKFLDDIVEGDFTFFTKGETQRCLSVVEEGQNLTKGEMLAILTRLGKNGKIIINGDNEQKDIRDEYNGLSYAIELSKKIPEIKWIKLKENHIDLFLDLVNDLKKIDSMQPLY